ncbi:MULTISPECIES: YqzK family protein [Bacillaceae]|uniref:YqzK family protein n=1 Tax=Evansella alkalicola TaxID=745819 RepID=A0ABS6K001_9BACI|nr:MULTISPECIES: YqzK family protein [Bacillaceae]MBU9724038.1 YqzK family protein [Bacillus alkalicola]
MKVLKSFAEAVWVFLLFMGCTLIFYYGILWVSSGYQDYHRYDEPSGRATKVFQVEEPINLEPSLWRLQLFLNHGE